MEIVLLIIVLAVICLLAFAASKPNTFRYDYSRVVKASPHAVYNELNTPQRSEKWSEWVAMDPDAHYSSHGPDSGVGAGVSWKGRKSGVGSMTITESTPDKLIRYKMEFIKPMSGVSTVEYILVPEGLDTRINFAMYGDNNFMGKLMSVFMDCGKMIIGNTEKSFAKMETVLADKAE